MLDDIYSSTYYWPLDSSSAIRVTIWEGKASDIFCCSILVSNLSIPAITMKCRFADAASNHSSRSSGFLNLLHLQTFLLFIVIQNVVYWGTIYIFRTLKLPHASPDDAGFLNTKKGYYLHRRNNPSPQLLLLLHPTRLWNSVNVITDYPYWSMVTLRRPQYLSSKEKFASLHHL